MGAPMAANLVRGGYQVTAHDIALERARLRDGAQRACGRDAGCARTGLRPDHHHAAERTRGAAGAAGGRRRRAGPQPACRQHCHRHELIRSGRHAGARRRARGKQHQTGGCAGLGRRAARQGRHARNHDRRQRRRGCSGKARTVENGGKAFRRRWAWLRPCHEGAQQFPGGDLVCGGERKPFASGGPSGSILR